MVVFIFAGGSQIKFVFQNLYNYFISSPVSTGFFLFLFIVAVLNIFKMGLVYFERKNGYLDQTCKYLFSGRYGPACRLPSCEQGFKDRNNSCEGCMGKTFSITNEEISEHIAASSMWKRIIILIANYSNALLPYISFFYTLFIAIFEKQINN